MPCHNKDWNVLGQCHLNRDERSCQGETGVGWGCCCDWRYPPSAGGEEADSEEEDEICFFTDDEDEICIPIIGAILGGIALLILVLVIIRFAKPRSTVYVREPAAQLTSTSMRQNLMPVMSVASPIMTSHPMNLACPTHTMQMNTQPIEEARGVHQSQPAALPPPPPPPAPIVAGVATAVPVVGASSTTFCAECGSPMDKGAKFCGECGAQRV